MLGWDLPLFHRIHSPSALHWYASQPYCPPWMEQQMSKLWWLCFHPFQQFPSQCVQCPALQGHQNRSVHSWIIRTLVRMADRTTALMTSCAESWQTFRTHRLVKWHNSPSCSSSWIVSLVLTSHILACPQLPPKRTLEPLSMNVIGITTFVSILWTVELVRVRLFTLYQSIPSYRFVTTSNSPSGDSADLPL